MSYQLTYRLWHILQLSWLNVSLKMYSFVYKANVILSSWPRCQVTKNKPITMHRHKSKRQSNTLQSLHNMLHYGMYVPSITRVKCCTREPLNSNSIADWLLSTRFKCAKCTWLLKMAIFLSIFTFEHILCLLLSLIYPAVYLLNNDLCELSVSRYST